MNKILTGFIVLIALSGCYYDSEEYLFPQINNNCDTTNVTYTLSVKPILENYCLSCHANNVAESSGGGIHLQDFADVKTKVNDGALLNSITRQTNPMPKNSGKLDNCPITIIKIWINNNAPEN
jgi:hypothetical protein